MKSTFVGRERVLLTKIENVSFDTECAVCFTGHRPEKLPGNGDLTSPEFKRLLSVLYLAISDSVKQGKTVFISGMARGIDLYAAKIVLELKAKHPDIKLICCIPFKNQEKKYTAEEKYDYMIICDNADAVVYTSDTYTADAFKKRNYFMVDNSSKLIGVVAEYKSGTGQTIRYAKKKGLECRIIDLLANKGLF